VPALAAETLLDPWWARLPLEGEPGRPRQHELVAVLSADFPPHTVVDLPGGRRPTDWRIAVRADVGGGRVHRVETTSAGPRLWYVELTEPRTAGQPAATTLVAFSDARFADGDVLGAEQAQRARVDGTRQVAALRWWPGTGLVHQLYVAAEHRRRGVAGKLVRVAFGVQAARGLPALRGDGRRTELGEEWRRGLPDVVSARMAPLSELMPPMTPGE
jgi:GNAT superfamily N-acetyltransferase